MARVIALDAGVLIGLFDDQDPHHGRAVELFTKHLDDGLVIGPVNLAEVLVRAARHGRDSEMLADIVSLGIVVPPLPADAATLLARLRASTNAKMPDCCVLLAAQQVDAAAVATFDQRLQSAATDLGFAALG